VVDALGDVVTEAAGEGTDLVQASVSGYTLSANVENLTLTGTAAIGTGNALNNSLTGNASANTLNGGAGSDTMSGQAGDDTYVIDVLTDSIIEATTGGVDLVQSSVSGYTLGLNLENLTLLGTAAVGTGNILNNVLTGNAAANTLDGGAGNDTMVGLAGNDTYVMNALTDVITEVAGGGTDTVQSNITGYTLGA
jgi:Ca2+-binding RTX toxin-like protein